MWGHGLNTNAAPAALSDDQRTALDDLFSPFSSASAPGLVVGVMRDGALVYRGAWGLASLEHGIANSPETRFRIGSTTKHMAALAALQLAELGLLDLDAPIIKYFPDIATPLGVPTVAQLMNHTNGLRCAQELAFLGAGLTIQPSGRHVEAYKRQTAANFPPGHGQIYNNGAFNLLSLLIEKVTGKSFEHVLRKNLFEPLGMFDTLVVRSDMQLIEGMATLHFRIPDGTWRRGLFVNEENLGEGAVVSTVDDMLVWAEAVRGIRPRDGSVGSDWCWSQLTKQTKLETGLTSNYGFGLWAFPYRGIQVVHHAGGVIGGNSQMLVAPDHALNIVILTNSSTIDSNVLSFRVLEILCKDQLGAGTKRPSIANREHLVGQRYVGQNGLFFGFDRAGDLLAISFLGSPAAPVFRQDDDGWLRLLFDDAAMGPFELNAAELELQGSSSSVDTITIRDGGIAADYDRVVDPVPTRDALSPLICGTYYSEDLEATARITSRQDAIRLGLTGRYGTRNMTLEPVSPSHFIATADDPIAPTTCGVAFELDADTGFAAGFQINTNRTRHLRFTRMHKESP